MIHKNSGFEEGRNLTWSEKQLQVFRWPDKNKKHFSQQMAQLLPDANTKQDQFCFINHNLERINFIFFIK